MTVCVFRIYSPSSGPNLANNTSAPASMPSGEGLWTNRKLEFSCSQTSHPWGKTAARYVWDDVEAPYCGRDHGRVKTVYEGAQSRG